VITGVSRSRRASQSSSDMSTRPGLPRTTVRPGTLRVTTEPAPTITSEPIVTPGSTMDRCQRNTRSPIVTGATRVSCRNKISESSWQSMVARVMTQSPPMLISCRNTGRRGRFRRSCSAHRYANQRLGDGRSLAPGFQDPRGSGACAPRGEGCAPVMSGQLLRLERKGHSIGMAVTLAHKVVAIRSCRNSRMRCC